MSKTVVLFVATLMYLASTAAQAVKLPGPLVETEWLAEHKDDVVILDVRVDTRSFVTPPRYIKDKKTGKQVLVRLGGHIPGARLVNFKDARTVREIEGRKVKKMLPPKEQFEKLMQKVGLNRNSAVVIVTKGLGNGDMTMAARMYWQLKYFGHDELAILNGGLAQWLLDGRSVTTDAPAIAKGDWTARAERREILATSEDVAQAVDTGAVQLVDNRPLSLYLGTWKKSYVRDKGHIPGAKPFPNELMTDPGAPAKFLPANDLRDLAREMGMDTDRSSITYCNSGHLAAGGWFILSELLGNKDVKLYDGSMHQWTLEKRESVPMKME